MMLFGFLTCALLHLLASSASPLNENDNISAKFRHGDLVTIKRYLDDHSLDDYISLTENGWTNREECAGVVVLPRPVSLCTAKLVLLALAPAFQRAMGGKSATRLSSSVSDNLSTHATTTNRRWCVSTLPNAAPALLTGLASSGLFASSDPTAHHATAHDQSLMSFPASFLFIDESVGDYDLAGGAPVFRLSIRLPPHAAVLLAQVAVETGIPSLFAADKGGNDNEVHGDLESRPPVVHGGAIADSVTDGPFLLAPVVSGLSLCGATPCHDFLELLLDQKAAQSYFEFDRGRLSEINSGAHGLKDLLSVAAAAGTSFPSQQSASSTDEKVAVTLVMMFDSRQRAVGREAVAVNQAYAAAHGYNFVAFNKTFDGSRATAWSKLKAVEAALDGAGGDSGGGRPVDWAIWLDADALVRSDEAAGSLALSRLVDMAHWHPQQPDLVFSVDPPQWQCTRLCSGIFMVRNRPSARLFLQLWWDAGLSMHSGTFVHSFPWEQQILNALIKNPGVLREHNFDERRIMALPYCALNDQCAAGQWAGGADQGNRAGSGHGPVGAVSHCMGEKTEVRVAAARRVAREAGQTQSDAKSDVSLKAGGGTGGVAVHPVAGPRPRNRKIVVLALAAMTDEGESAVYDIRDSTEQAVSRTMVSRPGARDVADFAHEIPIEIVDQSSLARQALRVAASYSRADQQPVTDTTRLHELALASRLLMGAVRDSLTQVEDEYKSAVAADVLFICAIEQPPGMTTTARLSNVPSALCSDWSLALPPGAVAMQVLIESHSPKARGLTRRCTDFTRLTAAANLRYARLKLDSVPKYVSRWLGHV